MEGDVDFTRGFRFDIKTLGVLLALAGSWYTQTGKIDSLREVIELREKTRIEVEAAKREADEARRQLDAQERKALADALTEVRGQLKLTALDVSDLKVAIGPAKPRG